MHVRGWGVAQATGVDHGHPAAGPVQHQRRVQAPPREVAALLLGAWAVGTMAVGIVTLYRRDP
jgi:hypothetical protein